MLRAKALATSPHKTAQAGNRRRLVPLFAVLLLAAALVLFLPLRPALCMAAEGKTALALPLGHGETFALRYTHSVNRSPVVDTLQWVGGSELWVRSSLFQSYGAGIPAINDGVGTQVRQTQEGFLLEGIDTSHQEIALLTGTYADHHLLYRGREIRLKDLVGEQRLVVFRVGRVSLWASLLGG